MPFYVCISFNEKGEYSGREAMFFNNEAEKIDFSKEFYEKYGEDSSCILCNSLKEIIANVKFAIDLCSWQIRNKEIVEIHDDIIRKFGLDFIHENFPTEEMNAEFVSSVEDECDRLGQEFMAEYYETEFDSSGCPKEEKYYDDDNNSKESYDNELRRWDEETDGSWRIENDFG